MIKEQPGVRWYGAHSVSWEYREGRKQCGLEMQKKCSCGLRFERWVNSEEAEYRRDMTDSYGDNLLVLMLDTYCFCLSRKGSKQ